MYECKTPRKLHWRRLLFCTAAAATLCYLVHASALPSVQSSDPTQNAISEKTNDVQVKIANTARARHAGLLYYLKKLRDIPAARAKYLWGYSFRKPSPLPHKVHLAKVNARTKLNDRLRRVKEFFRLQGTKQFNLLRRKSKRNVRISRWKRWRDFVGLRTSQVRTSKQKDRGKRDRALKLSKLLKSYPLYKLALKLGLLQKSVNEEDKDVAASASNEDEAKIGSKHGLIRQLRRANDVLPREYVLTSFLERLSSFVADTGNSLNQRLKRAFVWKQLSQIELRKVNETMLVARIQAPNGFKSAITHVSARNHHLFLRLNKVPYDFMHWHSSDHLIPLPSNVDTEKITTSKSPSDGYHYVYIPLLQNANNMMRKTAKDSRLSFFRMENIRLRALYFINYLREHQKTQDSTEHMSKLTEVPETFSDSNSTSSETIPPPTVTRLENANNRRHFSIGAFIVTAYLFGMVILVAGFSDALRQYKAQQRQRHRLDGGISLPYQDTSLYNRLEF